MTHPHHCSNDLSQNWLLDYVSRGNGGGTHYSLTNSQTISPLFSLLTESWAPQIRLLPKQGRKSWLVKANHDPSIPLPCDWFRKGQMIQFWPMRTEGKYTPFPFSPLLAFISCWEGVSPRAMIVTFWVQGLGSTHWGWWGLKLIYHVAMLLLGFLRKTHFLHCLNPFELSSWYL